MTNSPSEWERVAFNTCVICSLPLSYERRVVIGKENTKLIQTRGVHGMKGEFWHGDHTACPDTPVPRQPGFG